MHLLPSGVRLKRLLSISALVFALGLACTGATDPAADAPPEDPSDGIVVVPVRDDGRAHFCCEYTESDKQLFAILPNARACANRFGDRGGKWVEGPQCLPCCCEIPLSVTDPSQGTRHELTVPSLCVGSGQCVSANVPECLPKGARPRKDPVPKKDPEPSPPDEREIIKPK